MVFVWLNRLGRRSRRQNAEVCPWDKQAAWLHALLSSVLLIVFLSRLMCLVVVTYDLDDGICVVESPWGGDQGGKRCGFPVGRKRCALRRQAPCSFHLLLLPACRAVNTNLQLHLFCLVGLRLEKLSISVGIAATSKGVLAQPFAASTTHHALLGRSMKPVGQNPHLVRLCDQDTMSNLSTMRLKLLKLLSFCWK